MTSLQTRIKDDIMTQQFVDSKVVSTGSKVHGKNMALLSIGVLPCDVWVSVNRKTLLMLFEPEFH